MTERLHTSTRTPGTAPDVADAAHRIGRRRFLAAAGAAGAGALALGFDPATAQAATVPSGAGQFVPLPEVVRVLDTREPAGYTFTRVAGNHVRLPLAGRHGIAANATAVVATVTTVNQATGNWVSVVPAGVSIEGLLAQNRLVSVLNMIRPGEAVANLTQVMLAGGSVELYSLTSCEMIFDVIGYYRPVTDAVREGRYVGLPEARRALDTRTTFGYLGSGQTLTVELTAFVPADASGVVMNLTATECTGPGHFTVFPHASAAVPFASCLNVNDPAETRAAAVVVPVRTEANGRRYVKVYAHSAAKLVVDVSGYFTSSTSDLSTVGLFVPVEPARVLDTRDPGQVGRLWPGWTVEGGVPGAGAAAGSVAVNLTGVLSRNIGHVTMAAARRPLPATSNLNFARPLQVVPNHAITPITSGHGFQVFSQPGSHVVVDYTGYYTGAPLTATAAAPVNPDPPSIGPDWVLRVPAIGLTSTVRAGNGDAVTNSGYSWHWTGTGYLGEEAHVASFAHRTTHGGIYRYLHYLAVGDQFTLTTFDGREYTYVVVRRDLTNGVVANILNATRLHPGATYSLIACSKTDFTPTNVNFRIVVTGALVSWREI